MCKCVCVCVSAPAIEAKLVLFCKINIAERFRKPPTKIAAGLTRISNIISEVGDIGRHAVSYTYVPMNLLSYNATVSIFNLIYLMYQIFYTLIFTLILYSSFLFNLFSISVIILFSHIYYPFI